MKPFNLDAALRGEPICDRRGRPMLFIAYLPHAFYMEEVLTISPDKGARIEARKRDGRLSNHVIVDVDLCMADRPEEMTKPGAAGVGQWRTAVVYPNTAAPRERGPGE